MAARLTDKFEQLRQSVLGNNQRGREVEVQPTGEIHIPEQADNGGQNSLIEPKPTKMSLHVWGMNY